MIAATSNIYNKNFSANSSNQINIGNYNNTSSMRNNPPVNIPPFNMNANGGNINFKIQNIQIKNSSNTSNVVIIIMFNISIFKFRIRLLLKVF